ncbi:MAG: hypothetical protein ACYTBV_04790 [Planctomycetota bacterium]|jgi:hypothetical protein
MGYFWAVLATIVLIVIVWGIVSSKIKNRRIRRATEKMLPKVSDHIQADRRYNIFLSHGKTLKNVRFIGISHTIDESNPYLPFPLCQWLIVEKTTGKKAYLKPESVRYYEDIEDEKE